MQNNPLPGSYYGPPIPPSQTAAVNLPYYNQKKWSRSIFLKLFIIFCVAFAVTVFVLWLVYRPTRMRVTVENATLTKFNLSNSVAAGGNPSLSYNLSTIIRIRNHNERVGIYYDALEADAYYYRRRFTVQFLPPFFQSSKNTTELNTEFAGSSMMLLGNEEEQNYQRENGNNVFNLEVWLYARVRYKFGSAVTRRHRVTVRCVLGVPLVNGAGGVSASRGSGFSSKLCDVISF